MARSQKLIEVALPLAAINEAAAREKMGMKHGRPSTLHLWWARRPLAAARAVIWASLVDDPSCDDSMSAEDQAIERKRLFTILERLVVWENSNDPDVLADARAEIRRCFPNGAPPVLDPFGGGGAIPLEAQRLGLDALSGDLNPVAVLIQKAMLEIPPRFGGRPPVAPGARDGLKTWSRAQGLAADVEEYGRWMRDEAERRIGQHYPALDDKSGEPLTPVAWIWARTVESPDPSWHGHVPLVASWTLSKKKGKPTIWVEPIVDHRSQTISYEIREGGRPSAERSVDRGHGTCIATGSAIPGDYIKSEARAGRMGQTLIAIVAEGPSGRVYRPPVSEQETAADVGEPPWKPHGRNPEKLTGGTVFVYGMDEWWKLFTSRQLLALTTFSDVLTAVHEKVTRDAKEAGMSADGVRLRLGGSGATAYADAVVTYLAFAIDKLADTGSSVCSWDSTLCKIRTTFARQAIPMTWDFAEGNPFGGRTGSFDGLLAWMVRSIEHFPASGQATAVQMDARVRVRGASGAVISTDPPYYDNISYADLSDFFFVWLRRNLAEVWPDECATLLTPKADELIANRYRAGSKEAAEKHFESGMAELMALVSQAQPEDIPATIYYAYKATESRDGEARSTGWDTFLQAVVDSGMQVTATWPMRTELGHRMIASGTNALASSIVLTCRRRPASSALASRGEFVATLRRELPEAVHLLQSGNIAPVDMAQSALGPGIRVFSQYAKVVEADGSTMTVSTALSIINGVLGEVLDGEDADLDADTRFATAWFAQHGYNPAPSGDADGLARAKNTSLRGLSDAGIGEARGGTFRLFERSELSADWSPKSDDRLTVWEATQHLVAALDRSETEAAALLQQLGGYGDRARQLAYVLFHKATDKGWAEEAGAYNGLILAWPTLQSIGVSRGQDQQQLL